MNFFTSWIFLFTVLLQIAGPLFMSFGDWANVIQYFSGFGMAYALWGYIVLHKKDIDHLKQRIEHLHEKLEDHKHAN